MLKTYISFRIQIPGEKVLNLSPDWDNSPGFQYFGQGLAKGQCGVTIQQVKSTNHGLVQCSLGTAGDEMTGSTFLTVARKFNPFISDFQ